MTTPYYQTVRTFLSVVLGVLFLLYMGYQMRAVVQGPIITIASPSNGSALANEHIVLRGVSTDIASLSVNGHQIFTDQQGNFNEDLLLLDGYNVIEVRATDKFGRTRIKHLEVAYNKPQSGATVSYYK